MFALDQANALKEYLEQNHPRWGTATIEKVELPIPNRTFGFRAIGGGRYEGFFRLEEDSDYSLPFKAWGYFDVRDCELADDSEAGVTAA
jgi:hypothetical protein